MPTVGPSPLQSGLRISDEGYLHHKPPSSVVTPLYMRWSTREGWMGWGGTGLQFALDSVLGEENCFHFLFFLGNKSTR